MILNPLFKKKNLNITPFTITFCHIYVLKLISNSHEFYNNSNDISLELRKTCSHIFTIVSFPQGDSMLPHYSLHSFLSLPKLYFLTHLVVPSKTSSHVGHVYSLYPIIHYTPFSHFPNSTSLPIWLFLPKLLHMLVMFILFNPLLDVRGESSLWCEVRPM